MKRKFMIGVKSVVMLILMLTHKSSYSQKIEIGKPTEIEKPKFGVLYCGISGEKEYKVFVDNHSTTSFKNYYEIKDFSTGLSNKSEEIVVEIDGKKGEIFYSTIDGSTIYELVRFIKSTAIATNCKVAIITRNSNDLKQTGFVLLNEEFSIYNSQDYPTLLLKCFTNGIYVFAGKMGGSNQNNYLVKYDSKLNKIFEENFAFVNEVDVFSTQLNIDENGIGIVVFNFYSKKEVEFKSKKITPTTTFLYLVNENNEGSLITPEINENIVFGKSQFFYNIIKKELSAVFFTKNALDSKKVKLSSFGYAFYRWSLTGEVLASTSKIFRYNEVWNENVIPYLKEKKVKEISNSNDYYALLEEDGVVFQKSNGNLVIFFKDLTVSLNESSPQNSYLENSKFIFELDLDGNILWKKFILASQNQVYKTFKVIVVENEIYVFFKDFINKTNVSILSENLNTTSNAQNTLCYYGIIREDSKPIDNLEKVLNSGAELFYINDINAINKIVYLNYKKGKQIQYVKVTF